MVKEEQRGMADSMIPSVEKTRQMELGHSPLSLKVAGMFPKQSSQEAGFVVPRPDPDAPSSCGAAFCDYMIGDGLSFRAKSC